MSIILALLIFSALVLFHEFGHFLFAKISGIEVLEFSLGMGPRLLSFEKGGTRYSIKLFLFGGSCAMKGEDGEDESAGSFNAASVWGRIATVAAGPIFNFVMAFAIAIVVVAMTGYDSPYITMVEEGSPAAEAGLQEGDVITSINGYRVHLGRDLYSYMNYIGIPSGTVKLDYIRDGEKKTLTFVPETQEKYMLGLTYSPDDTEATISSLTLDGALAEAGLQAGDVILEVNGTVINTGEDLEAYFEEHPLDGSEMKITYLNTNQKIKDVEVTPKSTDYVSTGFSYNLSYQSTGGLGILHYAYEEVYYWIRTTIMSLRMLLTGKVSVNQMSGPVGIVETIGDTYESTVSYGIKAMVSTMLEMVILLSANLGVMNLLPLPALDGGRLVFLILEAIRRKPVNREIEGRIHLAGFMLLMGLIVFISVHDVMKLF